MPLAGYGVAIGAFTSFQRDPQDQYGRWYHGHINIRAGTDGAFTSALDVDTPSGVGVSYRLTAREAVAALGPVAALPDGWHALASTPTSGAIDYVRSAFLLDYIGPIELPPVGPVHRAGPPVPRPDPPPPAAGDGAGNVVLADGEVSRDTDEAADTLPPPPAWYSPAALGTRALALLPFIPRIFRFRRWVASTGDNALTALEHVLPGSQRVFLFGQHYASGNGVHNVHMNQGDPVGSPHAAGDGVWQDGMVAVQVADGSLFCWQVRFNSQSLHTDAAGRPL